MGTFQLCKFQNLSLFFREAVRLDKLVFQNNVLNLELQNKKYYRALVLIYLINFQFEIFIQ